MISGPDAYQFTNIYGAVALSDGSVAVSDWQTLEIRVFDSRGVIAATFGGLGDGPGEFRQPADLGYAEPDTLIAWDSMLRRVTWFRLDGSVIRTAALTGPSVAAESFPRHFGPGFAKVLGDGSILQRPLQSSPSNTVTSAWLLRPDPPASVELATMSFGEQIVSGRAFATSPFTAQAAALAGRHDPTTLFIADEEQWEVRAYDAQGNMKRLIRLAAPRRPVTEALEAEAMDSLVVLRPTAPREDLTTAFERLSHPDSVAAIRELHWDRSGFLWIGETPVVSYYGPPSRFQVIDSTGNWITTVDVPMGIGSVKDIGHGRIVTTWHNELGVAFIRVHTISR